MPEAVADIIADLDTFEPGDDSVDNEERLQIWVDRWEETPDKEQALASIFALFERYPEINTLGEPGPLVHAAEEISGYEQELAASLQRMPSYYGVWMVNRILGSDLPADVRSAWLEQLHAVVTSENGADSVKSTAQQFIEFQEG